MPDARSFENDSKGISMKERIWRAFFEYICTNSVASFGLEGVRTPEDLSRLDYLLGLVGLRQGLIRDAIWDNPRVLPVLEDDQPLFALMTNSSNESSASLNASNATQQHRAASSMANASVASMTTTTTTNASRMTPTAAGGIDFTGDVSDEDGFSNSGSYETDPAITTLSNDWTKCMTTRMLSNRHTHEHLATSDEILLRPEDLPTIPGETGSSSVRTRTKRRLTPEEGINHRGNDQSSDEAAPPGQIKSSPFIRSLLEEWKVNKSPNVGMDSSTSSGKRKRKHAQIAARVDSQGEVLFRAHKTVLSARSRYFRSMFRGPFIESAFASSSSHGKEQEEENRVVDFRGPADVLVVVLRYFYCGLDNELMDALSTDLDLCWRTFLVAHEYLLEGLQFYCERVIMSTITNLEDAVHASDALDLVNAPFIKTFCAHIAHVDSQTHSKTKRNLARQVLENVGLPTTLCSIQLCNQRIDSGGVEGSDELEEGEASSSNNGKRKRVQHSSSSQIISSSSSSSM